MLKIVLEEDASNATKMMHRLQIETSLIVGGF